MCASIRPIIHAAITTIIAPPTPEPERARIALSRSSKDPSTVFGDVPSSSYYVDAVAWALDVGVTRGLRADRFGAGDSADRGQGMTLVHRDDPTRCPAAD